MTATDILASVRNTAGNDIQRQKEIRMYGCTVAQMREAVESSSTFKFSGPAMVAAGMLSDAQEMMAYEQPDFNVIEDQRQLLNRAKFVLFEYIADKQNG
jgi:hypothetical protein